MIRQHYQSRIDQQTLKPDASQRKVIDAMQSLFEDLERSERDAARLHNRLLARFGIHAPAPRGLYIWGGVGRGKTVLMNLFHELLPFEDKHRLHFHHFMLQVHADLAELQKGSGKDTRNPLNTLAKDYAQRYRVLCLDEFIVTNITDAMLLYGLLEALFRHGVVLIATSNRIPNDLYLNGLQRERFLPAIDLINRRTHVIHLDSDTDHRLELLTSNTLYHTPVTEETRSKLIAEFDALSTGEIQRDGSIVIQNRDIPYVALASDSIWFEFDVLCDAPRATPDYIEIAETYRTVFVSGVPVMDENVDDKARRFIYLIDELYDSQVSLVLSASTNVEDLYRGDMLAFAFRRTVSRLIEMQSESYLDRSYRRER